MRLLAIPLLLLVAASCGGSSSSPTATPTEAVPCTATPVKTPTVEIGFEGKQAQLEVEIADTPAERGTGLMHRACLPEDAGMIFAWPSNTMNGFYMLDTFVPLTVAFIQADGGIVHIEDMQPETTNNHTSPEPFRYAIEANQGWFAAHGITVGDTADVPASLSTAAVN